MTDIKKENFHSTCQTCNKLIPNQHFDCERELKKLAALAERERCIIIMESMKEQSGGEHCTCIDYSIKAINQQDD